MTWVRRPGHHKGEGGTAPVRHQQQVLRLYHRRLDSYLEQLSFDVVNTGKYQSQTSEVRPLGLRY